MVLLGNELAIYEDIQSTSKQSGGLQGFKQIRGAGRRPVSGVWSSTKPRACGPLMEADFDGYNSSTETGKY